MGGVVKVPEEIGESLGSRLDSIGAEVLSISFDLDETSCGHIAIIDVVVELERTVRDLLRDRGRSANYRGAEARLFVYQFLEVDRALAQDLG